MINVYTPSGALGRKERDELFYNDIIPYVNCFHGKAVMSGDFNAIYRRQASSSNETMIRYQVSKSFRLLIGSLYAIDTGKMPTNQPKNFTRFRRHSNKIDWTTLVQHNCFIFGQTNMPIMAGVKTINTLIYPVLWYVAHVWHKCKTNKSHK